MTNITRITPKDIRALLGMIRKLCAFHGDTCRMGLEDTQRRFIGGSLTGWIAHEGGAAVGYAAIKKHWQPTSNGDLLDITHLFVEEHLRGRGIDAR